MYMRLCNIPGCIHYNCLEKNGKLNALHFSLPIDISFNFEEDPWKSVLHNIVQLHTRKAILAEKAIYVALCLFTFHSS